MWLILVLIALPALFSLISFIGFLVTGKRVINIVMYRVAEIGAFLILPFIYLSLDTQNDCCNGSAPFSPEHILSIWTLIVVVIVAYFYSSFRSKIATPLIEVVVNSLLVTGIGFNFLVAYQTKEPPLALFGNMPIILCLVLALVKNQLLFIEYSRTAEFGQQGKLQRVALKILILKPFLKYPLILILGLPVLIIISSILLLFGQKPDSFIRAFTETYKHGFSQWDYQCANVQCGGHYLCSVAANGHKNIVKPQRRGTRNGQRITCNRQLLISNAFEDLLQERAPFFHRMLRRQYNKIGNFVHRYYVVFENKIVSDCMYILMKPVEWLFLLFLYAFDRKPENRISKQYLDNADRQLIEDHYNILIKK